MFSPSKELCNCLLEGCGLSTK